MTQNLIPVVTGDRPLTPYQELFSVLFVLDRLRSAHNVGNIFRIAEITAMAGVVTCGYTACPPHPKLAKTARGCEELVPHRHYETTLEAVMALKAEGWKIYAVETVESAPFFWDCTYEGRIAFVLGNEAEGIDQEVLLQCDHFIKLPTFGYKNSLNVGNCAAVLAYELVRQKCQLESLQN